jgi:hypothetical protein
MEPAVAMMALLAAVAIGGIYVLADGTREAAKWRRRKERLFHPIKTFKARKR